jgi:subtilisin family serine protease
VGNFKHQKLIDKIKSDSRKKVGLKPDAFCGISDIERLDISPIAASQAIGWQVETFDFPQVWSETQGQGVKVAVIDSGVDTSHPDLNIARSLDFVGISSTGWWDAENERVIAPDIDYGSYTPTHDHGTHVSGIIAAKNNDIGMVGVAPECEIYALRALNESGSGSYDDISIALLWCLYNEDIDIVNMSLGGFYGYEPLWETLNLLYKNNIACIVSAGNEYYDPEYRGYISFPAQYDETISVASLDQDEDRSYFSSVGPNLDVAAPGRDIFSTIIGGGYGVMSGTSMAAPFVSGLAALVISKHRLLGGTTPVKTVEDLRSHISKTAKDDELFDDKDIYRGFGLVQVDVAVGVLEEKQKPSKSPFGKVYGGSIMQYNDRPWQIR